MSNSSLIAKKIFYCGIALVAAVLLSVLLCLMLPFYSIHHESGIKYAVSGFKVLFGMFDASGNAPATAFLWVSMVLMWLFVLSSLAVIFLATRQLLKNENVINAPYFLKILLAPLFLMLAIFACSLVSGHLVANKLAGLSELFNIQWLPLILVIAISVLAKEFLQKLEYDLYDTQAPATSCCGGEENSEMREEKCNCGCEQEKCNCENQEEKCNCEMREEKCECGCEQEKCDCEKAEPCDCEKQEEKCECGCENEPENEK